MEGEGVASARLWVEAVGEVGLDTGGFVEERQRAAPGGQAVRQAGGVSRRLTFYSGQGGAGLFGFDDACGLAVDVEQVVGETVARVQGEFTQGDAATGMDVRLVDIEDLPAGQRQQLVDLLPRLLFWLRRQD